MRYTKIKYDIDGSAWQPRDIQAPTDSVYGIGVEVQEDGWRMPIGAGDISLTDGTNSISADSVFNDVAIFKLSSDGEAGKSMNFDVKMIVEPTQFNFLCTDLSSSKSFPMTINFKYDLLNDLTAFDTLDPMDIQFAKSKMAETESELVMSEYAKPDCTAKYNSDVQAVFWQLADRSYANTLRLTYGGKNICAAKAMVDGKWKYGWIEIIPYGDPREGKPVDPKDFIQVDPKQLTEFPIASALGVLKKTDPVQMAKVSIKVGKDINAKLGTLNVTQTADGVREI